MMDPEKASTDSLDPTVEEHLMPQPSSSSSSKSSLRNNKWLWGGVAAAVVISVVVFPAVYVTQQRNKSNNNGSNGNGVQNTQATADNQQGAIVNTTTPGGIFNQSSKLGLFDASVLEGYDNNNPEDLKRDVALAAWFLVGQVVQRNNGVAGYESVGVSQQNGGNNFGGGRPGTEAMPVSADTNSGGAASNGRPNGQGSSYGTNNQETNVEEGDLVVSDGQFVYAAYNDYLIIWNPLDGTQVAQIQMPDIVLSTNQSSAGGYVPTEGSSDPYYWYPKPQIQSLLVSQGRLLVVVSGYGQALMAEEGMTDPALVDYLNTHLRVYDTATLTASTTSSVPPQPIRTANVQGTYNGVRSTNGTVYLMSLSGINTYTDLILPFEKWNNPDTLGQMNEDQYTQQSYETAQQQAIPKFVNKLVSELGKGDAGMPQLVRLSSFENEYSGTGAEDLTFPSGFVNTLALIHSFSMLEDASDPILTVASSGAFLPSYWAQFYGSATHLIVAGQGQRVDAGTGYTVESTNFLAFRLASGAVVPDSVGSVDGYIINNYAIDVANGVLRVGVSINNQWFFLTDPMPMEGGNSAGLETTNGEAPPDTTTSSPPAGTTNSTTENYIVILTMPGPYNATEAGTMSEVGRLQLGKPNELFTALRFYDNIAYAVTFERTDPLYVLDLSDPANPKVLAALDVLGFSSYLHSLNSDNTLLLGVGQAADANGTTTGTKLSLYNAQNPAAPFVAAEYVISNTDTRYTYSAAQDDPKAGRYVPDMNTFAIPIEANDWSSGYRFNGFWTFYVNATHILKECEIGHAYNETLYYVDPVPVDVGGGVATDPSTGTAEGSDGSSGTSDSGGSTGSDGSDAMPGSSEPSACFYCAWLPPRAMIFSGNLMTINNHFIRSNDLDTCAQEWALDVVIKDNSTLYGCCAAYG